MSSWCEQLLEVQRSGTQVEIVVSTCLYACCGGRWLERDGYEQTYRGVIKDVNIASDSFLLHAIAVSSLNYAVLASISDLQELVLVD